MITLKINMATDVYKDFSRNKEMFYFSNYSTESKYCDDSNKLVIGKVKDETSGHLLNRIQSKDHRIGTYEINKIPLSCLDDRTYI